MHACDQAEKGRHMMLSTVSLSSRPEILRVVSMKSQ